MTRRRKQKFSKMSAGEYKDKLFSLLDTYGGHFSPRQYMIYMIYAVNYIEHYPIHETLRLQIIRKLSEGIVENLFSKKQKQQVLKYLYRAAKVPTLYELFQVGGTKYLESNQEFEREGYSI